MSESVAKALRVCCKGAPGRDRLRTKARNINDSLPATRRDPGLCNRFGQRSPSGRSREGYSAGSWWRSPVRTIHVRLDHDHGAPVLAAPGGPPGGSPAGLATTLRDAPRDSPPPPHHRPPNNLRGSEAGFGVVRCGLLQGRTPGRGFSGEPLGVVARAAGSGVSGRRRRAQCAVRGRSGRHCTFDRDPPEADRRNHAETPRRSTPLKSSHVQSGPLCTWEPVH